MTDLTDSQMHFHISLSEDIERFLVNQRIDLISYLQQQGVGVQLAVCPDPAGLPEESRTKDLALVIVASAAGIAIILKSLGSLIQQVSHRPVLVKRKILKPVEDSVGNVVYLKNGKVLLQWVEVTEFESPSAPSHKDSITIKCCGIELSYKTE